MTKEQLRAEFAKVLKEGITFSGQVGDYLINQSVFDFFWAEIEITKQLTISDQKTKEKYIEHLEAEIEKRDREIEKKDREIAERNASALALNELINNQ